MPIYEYWCEDCSRRQEFIQLQRGKVEDEMTCEICGAPARRVASAAAFFVEGSRCDFDGNPWEGTCLEDSDGVNELQHKGERPFIDLGG